MRTTLNLDEELLAEAQKACGESTKKATIERGLRALVQKAAAKQLAALWGKIPNAKAAPRRRPPLLRK